MAPKVKTPVADVSVETTKAGKTKVTVEPTVEVPVPTGVGEALGNALNPTVGGSVLDKVFPLVVAIVYVSLLVLTIFGVVPNTPEAMGAMSVISGIGGYYLRHVGSNAFR